MCGNQNEVFLNSIFLASFCRHETGGFGPIGVGKPTLKSGPTRTWASPLATQMVYSEPNAPYDAKRVAV